MAGPRFALRGRPPKGRLPNPLSAREGTLVDLLGDDLVVLLGDCDPRIVKSELSSFCELRENINLCVLSDLTSVAAHPTWGKRKTQVRRAVHL